MLKRLIWIILVAVILASLAGCGFKKKLNEKIAEQITEGVLDRVTGGKGDIDLDDGKITIQGEDGEEFTLGNTQWPKGDAADLVPEFKKGSIMSVMNSKNAFTVYIEGVEKADYLNYLQELKGKGFTNDPNESTTDDVMIYSANLNDNTFVAAIYNSNEKILNITVEIEQ